MHKAVKHKTPNRDSIQKAAKLRSENQQLMKNHRSLWKDRLMIAIIAVPILVAVFFIVLYAAWGSGPVIAVIPWFTPMFSTFIALTALSVAFLALGRYQVLCDPVSYWIGLTFAGLGIGLVFYVLAWPGLLPNGQSFIAGLTNTAGWMSALALSITGPFLLAAALLRWPAGQSLTGRRAVGSMIAWVLLVALVYILLTVFERILPIVVRDDGTYTPLLQVWNGGIVLVQIVGAVLSARRYRLTGDRLIGFVTFFQIALVYSPLLIIAGGQRYDIWWYLSRIVLVSGCLIVLYGLLSEYVHLFQKVRDNEARYRHLTESLPQLIWTCDAQGQFDFLSPQWVAYTGIPESAQLGSDWVDQLHPDDRQRTMDRWLDVLSTGLTFDIEYRIRRHDGMFRWFKTMALPIRNTQGQVIQWFGSCTDIEDQKQVEADLRELTDRLERSNRDLKDFAYVASHDLQEPLRKIEAFGDAVLEEPASLTERQSQYITRMRHAAARMRSMVYGLLQLARLEAQAQPFQKVDLSQIAAEVVSDLEIQIKQSGGQIELCDLVEIEADPQQMRQLLQNLLGNALKFHLPDASPEVKLYSHQPAPGTVEILVEDNGIGFDDQRADHLFEPFKRLVGRSAYEGSGIGLSICRKIVERHHGRIIAQSKPGQGATFIVTLPMQQNVSKNLTEEAYNDETQITVTGRGRRS
jgi:PAS domain S-box-containing protein